MKHAGAASRLTWLKAQLTNDGHGLPAAQLGEVISYLESQPSRDSAQAQQIRKWEDAVANKEAERANHADEIVRLKSLLRSATIHHQEDCRCDGCVACEEDDVLEIPVKGGADGD